MTQHYSDIERAANMYALPDLETFYRTREENRADAWRDGCDDVMESGWFYWYCFPGCLPDSEPIGPFDTEDSALDDAREYA